MQKHLWIFASTGHLTITSLHTDNSVSAFYRLERLGVTRTAMAESIIAVVAQRLIRKPCSYCRKLIPIPEEEIQLLQPFTDNIPKKTLHPVGCLKCNNTGYLGREGVFEILTITPEIAQMIRNGAPIQEVREFLYTRGDTLISGHGIAKIRSHVFAVNDVYQNVLLEEEENIKGIRKGVFVPLASPARSKEKKSPTKKAKKIDKKVTTSKETWPGAIPAEEDTPEPEHLEAPNAKEPIKAKRSKKKSILVIDDEKGVLILLKHYLEKIYDVDTEEDGVNALLRLSEKQYDLVISDINMPNLDGYNLLKIMKHQKIDVPVIYLTASLIAKDEIKGLAMGAIDYLKKPVVPEVLKLKLKRILGD